MKPFKVKTKTGQEKWYWVDGESLMEVDVADVPALIQKENAEKVVRAIERLQAEVSSARQWASNSPCSRWLGSVQHRLLKALR